MDNVITKEVGIGGTVLWSLSDKGGPVTRSALRTAWEAAGFGEFVPECRRPGTLLKMALEDVYAKDKVIVRPLKGKAAYGVFDEHRDTEKNEYPARMTARMDGDTVHIMVSDGRDAAVRAAYVARTATVDGDQLAGALVDIVTRRLQGVALRPSGGVYWLAAKHLPQYERLAAATKAAAPAAALYCMRNQMTPDTLVAVRDAVVENLTRDVREAESALRADSLTPRGAASRQAELKQLYEKVALFQSVLNEPLKELADELESAAALAAGRAQLYAQLERRQAAAAAVAAAA